MNILLKDLTAEQMAYFDACARIRDITTTRLMTLMVEVIAADQMVLSILDDESRYVREKGEHRFRQRKDSRS